MAAAFEGSTLVAGHCEGESCGGDSIRGVQRGDEINAIAFFHEEAEKRRSPMIGTKALEKTMIRYDEAAPTLANKGGTEKN